VTDCRARGLLILLPLRLTSKALAARQQWNFSPPGTVREVEDYLVDLSNVTVVELEIVPDKSSGEARASLESLRLA
jgi:hypothetical protein